MDLRVTRNEAEMLRAIVANKAQALFDRASNSEEFGQNRTAAANHLVTVLELLITLDQEESNE